MKNQFQLFIAIILFTVTLEAFASRPHFAHITINNGLPHQQVSSLAQDHKGYIWIGTRNGLSRYAVMRSPTIITILQTSTRCFAIL